MLFHITHVHTEATCPYGKPEVVRETLSEVVPAFAKAGATVVGSYIDPPGHTAYFIVEASDQSQIVAGLAPVVTMGRADIRLVTEYEPIVAALAEG